MDFFDHQEQARRKTGWLILLFVLAVSAIIAGLYLVVRGIYAWMYWMEGSTFSYSRLPEGQNSAGSLWAIVFQWDPQTFWIVSLATALIVMCGSLYKILQLREGGSAIALSLGGRPIDHSTKDPQERQLMNIVEEMALASGTPTPPVYLLDSEPGINAFAAGYTPDDAVIGVTKGCVNLLSREELQGVIAHEFSHILNGDMRLNINLIGWIHGILLIGLTGRVLLRGAFYGPRVRYRSKNSGQAALAAMAIGLSLMLIGALGVFFGNLIKAAVSRQREFLADAAAVQFTRLPGGLAGALKKIGGLTEGSVMVDPRSETLSHMFFSQGISGSLSSLFATHPPLIERIQRIEPRFKGQFPTVTRPEAADGEGRVAAFAQPGADPVPAEPVAQRPPQPFRPMPPQALPDPLAQIGQPNADHLDFARSLINGLPAAVRDAAHDPYGARALLYALLLHRDSDVRNAQIESLATHADEAVYRETLKFESSIKKVDPAARLPLIDMVIPTLGKLSPTQYRVFKTNLNELIHADKHVDLFEWMLQHVLLRHLEPKFRTVRKKVVQYYSLKKLTRPCAAVLSALAYGSNHDDAHAQKAFDAGAPHLQLAGLALLPRVKCALSVVDHALDVLAEASPREKRKILQACAGCILADEEVSVEEGELLRAVADSLGCPMPPLLPGQSVRCAA